jgi:hypothetical protein
MVPERRGAVKHLVHKEIGFRVPIVRLRFLGLDDQSGKPMMIILMSWTDAEE